MARVGRGAILAHRRARGIVGVEPVVTIEAQAAERARPERGEVASAWWVVIGDSRWGDAARFQAQPAQRLDTKLMRSAALPASSAIPTVNIRTVRHRGQGLPVFYTFQTARARCVETKRVWSAAHRDQRPMGFAVLG